MIIKYLKSNKEASDGDLKELKSGKKFIRVQQMYRGMYVVARGKPCYEWVDYDCERVAMLKKNIENSKDNIFKSTSETKSKKKKTLRFNFSLESDRKKYENLTGIKVKENTSIKTAKLEVSSW